MATSERASWSPPPDNEVFLVLFWVGGGAPMRHVFLLLVIVALPSTAQVHVSQSRGENRRAGYHQPAQPTSKECVDGNQNPWVAALCSSMTRGTPRASNEVVRLPAYGSDASKESGTACIGGLAMRRLPNGWEQVRDSQSNYVPCVDQ